MSIKLTKEQTLALENRKLKDIIADLLKALEKIANKHPATEEQVKETIYNAIERYQKDRLSIPAKIGKPKAA